MDNTEIHYLTYDPEEIFAAMHAAYIEAGGDVVYGGDEKEILLRGVEAILVQSLAGIDNALRMATLRYAAGDYLDLYGEKRGCERIQSAKAGATVMFRLRGGFPATTIPAGTALTGDGVRFYTTDEAINYTGITRNAAVHVTCTEAGSLGNGLLAGTEMQMTSSILCVQQITVTEGATGGNDREDDETYRARIREWALRSVTTGPAGMYENVAQAVSTQIIDTSAVKVSDGVITVYLLLEDDAPEETIKGAVLAALNDTSKRPLTDYVTVDTADDDEYQLDVEYAIDYSMGSNVPEAIAAAAEEYRKWQENTIGRAFNPDKLTAMLYQAGASRVVFAETSHFMEGDVEYTEIGSGERCKGTITLTEMTDDD